MVKQLFVFSKFTQSRLLVSLVAVGIGLVAIIVTFLLLQYLPGYQSPSVITSPLPSTTPPAEGWVCTLDAKICPDGSAVGRSGPTCEFDPCPGE